MFTRILVAVDPAAFPERALEEAFKLSKLHSGKVILLSVAALRLFRSDEQNAAHEGALVEAASLAIAQDAVEKAAGMAAANHVPCETVIAQSSIPSDDIVAVATRMQCDVIFVESRGRMGVIDTVFQESQTQSLLRKVHIPVLVFPRADKTV